MENKILTLHVALESSQSIWKIKDYNEYNAFQ